MGTEKAPDEALERRLAKAEALADARQLEIEQLAGLRETVTRLERAERVARLGFIDWDLDRNEITMSGEVYRMYGLPDDGQRPNPQELVHLVHPDDVDRVRTSMETAISGGADHDIEHRISRLDGSVLWVHAIASCKGRTESSPGNLLGVIRDISGRKSLETEKKELETQLAVQRRLESIGMLAGGVAHDFNNLLTVINTYTDSAIQSLPAGGQLRADLHEVRSASERATHLTRQLLAFSRSQILQPVVLDLNAAITELETMLRRLIREDIAIELLLAEGLGNTMADPAQIDQIIMNLAVNALDAMPAGGSLTIATANCVLGANDARRRPDLSPGPHVLLTVSDTGCGMDEDTRQRMFEPFFTTKSKHSGTGLGLSTVYGIVKQSEGAIWVDSEPGEGCVVSICLPRVERAAAAHEQKPPAAAIGGSERVLVVEDEDAVREMTRRILTRAGYAVVTAANGIEALRVCEQEAEPPHLVVTDMVMPFMRGDDLAIQLGATYPGIKVLFMSGYPDDPNASDAPAALANANFLAKPFSSAELLRMTRTLLDAPSIDTRSSS